MKKYDIIYNKYRNDILNGYMKPKQVLPSIRASCELFKTSKTTVEHAYQKLLLEGYIASIPSVGYYVSIDDEKISFHKQMDSYTKERKEISYQYDFRSQTVSFDSFEMNTWKRYLKDVLDDIGSMATYGDSQGEYVLREALASYAYKVRGVLAHPDRIVIASNYQSLLFMICGLFDKRRKIGMEDLHQLQAKRVFDSYGFQTVMIDHDDEGIVMESLKKAEIDILYLNSASSGKKKKPISSSLRDQMIKYCSENDILILEDDYNGELSYVSLPHYAMQGYALKDNIIYCGSFSRLLLPSFRISYMVLNEECYLKYLKHKREYGPTASKLEQLALYRYIMDGYLEKHLRKLKKEYKEKNKQMRKALKKYIDYSYYLDEAYLSYVIDIHDMNEELFKQKCDQRKIAIPSIDHHQLKLSFASISNIEEAIKEISQLLKEAKM